MLTCLTQVCIQEDLTVMQTHLIGKIMDLHRQLIHINELNHTVTAPQLEGKHMEIFLLPPEPYPERARSLNNEFALNAHNEWLN